jgi:membrane associated rhomboid family serine protease
MLYLWIFGNNIEDTLGHFRFLLFYLVCGLFAGAAQVLADPNSTVPMIGASGAIGGILGAYLLLFPSARILTLVFILFFIKIVRIPALIILGFWFFIQILSVGGGAISNVAFFAHIGGFISGLVLVKLFQPKQSRSRRKWA